MGRLYGVIAGSGCSNGVANPRLPNGVIRIRRDGSWSYVANLSAFYISHPTANPNPDDFTADGVPYGMIAWGRSLYIVEANHGSVDRVATQSGLISRVTDISASKGHIVPIGIARRGGSLFIGNLGRFPIKPGTEHVYRISKHGGLRVAASGLTAVVGVAFDRRGRMYVLETSTVGPFPGPSAGRVVRLSESGEQTTIAAGLRFPTAMIVGPDGALYVSTRGYNLRPGDGRLLRIGIAD